MRKIAMKIIAVSIGIILAISIGELVIRCTSLSQSWQSLQNGKRINRNVSTKDKIGHRRIPDTTFVEPGKIVYCINSLGFRDKPRVLKKSSKVRIGMLGDSVTEGVGVHEKDRFSNRLQDLIDKNKLDAEVINFGIAGQSTYDEKYILEQYGLKFSPDIVFLQVCQNDFERNEGIAKDQKKTIATDRVGANKQDYTKPKRGIIPFLQKRSAFYLFFAERYNYLKLKLGFPTKLLKQSIAIGKKEWQITLRCISEINDICMRNNATLIVIYVPLQDEVLIGSDHIANSIQEEIESYCDKMKIRSINVIDALREYQGKNDLYLDYCHLSPEGNKKVAETIFDEIIEEI